MPRANPVPALLALAAAGLVCTGMGRPPSRLPPIASWSFGPAAAADLIVGDPEAGPPPARRGLQVRLARLSLGVSEPSRSYHRLATMIPTVTAGPVPGRAGHLRLDPRNGAWRGLLLGEVVPRYAKAGWDGLYLTDLEVGIALEAAGTHEAAATAMAELVHDIRGLEPDLRLVATGAQAFMPALARYLDAIAAPATWRDPPALAAWQALHAETGLPVLVPAPDAAAAAQAKASGFVPSQQAD